MKSSVVTFLAVLASAALISACGSDDDGGTGPGPTPPVFNGTVSVRDNSFSPRDITISVGDSVTWSFEGSNLHTVTEGANANPPSPLFDSPLMRSGTFGYRFTTAGAFPYHCRPHIGVGMTGSVTVAP